MEIRSTALKQALEQSLLTGDETQLIKVLRRHRRFRLTADELVTALADRHQHIETRFLHPKLLPLDLLLAPERWFPDSHVFDGPALQALLADIEAGKVDIVVVYKVDRLTRSLADFAKIVEIFDAHAVSFVSITQAFKIRNEKFVTGPAGGYATTGVDGRLDEFLKQAKI